MTRMFPSGGGRSLHGGSLKKILVFVNAFPRCSAFERKDIEVSFPAYLQGFEGTEGVPDGVSRFARGLRAGFFSPPHRKKRRLRDGRRCGCSSRVGSEKAGSVSAQEGDARSSSRIRSAATRGQGPGLVGRRLQVARPEAEEESVGGEEDEPEGGNGHRMVMEVIVGVPVVGVFVAALIFNLSAPASVFGRRPAQWEPAVCHSKMSPCLAVPPVTSQFGQKVMQVSCWRQQKCRTRASASRPRWQKTLLPMRRRGGRGRGRARRRLCRRACGRFPPRGPGRRLRGARWWCACRRCLLSR